MRTARSTNLLSVVFNGDASQLTNIAAVTAGYPLRGRVLVADRALRQGHAGDRRPAAGRSVAGLEAARRRRRAVGSRLAIGAAEFRVGRVLISRPDQGGTFAELAPNLLMNAADLPATRLIQPGSRVSYGGLFAGERCAHRCLQALARCAQASRRAAAGHHRGESAGTQRRGARRTLPEPREPRERAAVRDRGRDVSATLRPSPPGHRRAAEDTRRNARLHPGGVGAAAAGARAHRRYASVPRSASSRRSGCCAPSGDC